jgi:hypothetical protein
MDLWEDEVKRSPAWISGISAESKESDGRDLRISDVADNLGENDERKKNQKNGMDE